MTTHKRTAIIGAAGRMGASLIRCIDRNVIPELILSGAVDLSKVPGQGVDAGTLAGCKPTGVALTADLPALTEHTDVFIDFSFHAGIDVRGKVLAAAGKPWVIGTTGVTYAERAHIKELAKQIPIVLSSNMSLGVNLLSLLVEEAAAALRGKGYDIEIVDMHHRKKVDSPSGTALLLAESAAAGAQVDLKTDAIYGRHGIVEGDRPEQQIAIHALRGGDVVGDHDVIFAAEGEMLKLSHRATSRDTFAIGALQAAAWVVGQPAGLYTMKDVLGLGE